ncbi:conserved hypothetical protein [Histoplasma mississippiense (nom. inval.)]|uniref:conserved hypothetical protein n=1 Tax=Ajellomyces capsulatus (strain NAm1 / WU24) TaxID=2059318 RepID=UPI000157BF0A|nr:conserved hypothetical protein [Histoplasma mississippiense (nom. inval.)]EDN06975.1 conserved hypothetical protein [Histoplasma mississippiense (nom. inval.)]
MNTVEKNFHHPFIPYDIQRQFMQALFDCIEGGKVGIFESPTEWMLEYSRREKTRFIREKREQLEARLAKIRADEERQRKQFVDGNHTSKKRKLTAGNDASEQGYENQFELEDYYSDNEERTAVDAISNTKGVLSADTLALLEKLNGGPVDDRADSEPEDEIRVFYCSRTHSQLTQFAHELRRVKLPPSIPPEIVTLPYPLLLQRSARDALNISLKNHVVIIDEAHNLIDAISDIHSVSVSLSQLQLAIYQLTTYARKYKTHLKGSNRVYVTQVIRLLSRYLHKSKLARKVDGFTEQSSMKSQAADKNATRLSVPVLFQVQSFVLSLMNPSSEGKLFYEISQNDVFLKYMLLDPTNHFREIVEDSRSVILAGGRLETFSFGHVIPPDNLAAIPVVRGTCNTEFDFTYGKRNDESMIIDLGKTIAALCCVIPDGVVAFFPSYDYLNLVLMIWKKHIPTTGPSIIDSIQRSKAVFHESQDKATDVDELLQGWRVALVSYGWEVV